MGVMFDYFAAPSDAAAAEMLMLEAGPGGPGSMAPALQEAIRARDFEAIRLAMRPKVRMSDSGVLVLQTKGIDPVAQAGALEALRSRTSPAKPASEASASIAGSARGRKVLCGRGLRCRSVAPVTVRDLLRALPVFDCPLPSFDPESAPAEPSALFMAWLREAIEAGVREPHAMTISTVDGEGRPDSRVLILKDVDADRWEFATSAISAKGAQLAAVPHAALSFHWREQGRQVRVRGAVTAADPGVSAADFLAKPDGSRIAGLVGRQSAVLEDPRKLALEIEAAGQRLADDPRAVPPDHTVYLLTPDQVEFWQGERERQHVRLRYRRAGDAWVSERLWP